MPGVVEVDRHQTVHNCTVRRVVGQTLVAQTCGDSLCPQDRCQQMRLGVAESDPLAERVTRRDRHPGVLGIKRMGHLVPHPFEGSLCEVRVVEVAGAELMGQGLDFRMLKVNDLVRPEVVARI